MKKFMTPLVTIGITLGAGLLFISAILAASGHAPALTLQAFFTRPFSSAWQFGNMLNLAGLLILAGTGSALAIRGGTFNLGGEVQLYAPALVTAVILAGASSGTGTIAAAAPASDFLALPLLLIAGAAAVLTGALLGFIPGTLKAKFGTDELIVSFLLSAALVPTIDYLVAGPLRDPAGSLMATTPIDKAFRLPSLLAPSSFNLSFFLAIALALCAAFVLRNTGAGYRYRVTGAAPEFARFEGFPVGGITAASMTLAGAFHGLAGFFAITGTWFTCHQGLTSGMGWGALAVALIARASPAAVIPAAILYAWLETASDTAMLSSASGFDTTSIVQAVIFLVVSARYLPRFTKKRTRHCADKVSGRNNG